MKKPPGGIIILNMSTTNENHMMYDSWDMKCAKQNFFVILGYFLPSYPHNSPKIENWKKLKKNTWRYHHFTQVYEKSWSYAILFLRYGAWRMKLLLFMLGYFLPLYPHNSPKNEKFKKMKKMQKKEISSFYTCVPKLMIIRYTVPEIWHVKDVIVIFHFQLFFALLPP